MEPAARRAEDMSGRVFVPQPHRALTSLNPSATFSRRVRPAPRTSAQGRTDAMSNLERDQLRQMLLDRSMRFGEFVLSSGATSNYYIDVRKTSLHPDGLNLIARLFWEQLEKEQVTAVGGLTLGDDTLVAGVLWWCHEDGKPIET